MFGDSNTWGWVPVTTDAPPCRYADGQRWAGVLQTSLGSDYAVRIKGLPGRTLATDLPGTGELAAEAYNGLKQLAAELGNAAPVDVLILMLGTNDLIDALHRTPDDIAKFLPDLARTAAEAMAPRHGTVLLVVPPPLGDTSRGPFARVLGPKAREASHLLAPLLIKEAAPLGLRVFDAGNLLGQADGSDGVHLSAAAHARLGLAVAAEVRCLKAVSGRRKMLLFLRG